MVRVLKRISIERDNWRTISIRCVDDWTRTPHGVTDNNRVINQGNSNVNSKVSRDNKVNRGRGNTGRDNKASKVKKDLKAVNSKVVNPVAGRKTAVRNKPGIHARAPIVSDRWEEMAGVITASSRLRYASACAKPRTFDGSGARPE